MSYSGKILWLDDNPGRASTAEDLGAHFIDVRGKDLDLAVKDLLTGRQPRLVIIDHVLDKTTTTHPLFLKGSTIAQAIKELWPSCPVVGVTNAGNIEGIDLRTKGAYDVLFPFHNFSKYHERIAGIASGFTLVAKVSSRTDKLVALLKPPKDELERLRSALTDDLKMPPQDKSIASRMFRWVAHLMDRPGFLLDALWSATFLGLNEAGFQRVESTFSGAKYLGVFRRPDELRWWSSDLSKLLYRHSGVEVGELSWHAGRRLGRLAKKHFSSCYYCGGDFPETVAYLDAASDDRRPMHLKCTVPHPAYQRELYFEDMRMMR